MNRIPQSRKEKFEEIANSDENALNLLWEYVAPHMSKRERARKAALISLASHNDKAGMRGRTHLLMVGPPGTGKTEIRNWIRYNITGAVGIGPKSSEAGLKGDASGEDLTPGALAMAHGGMLCIEELDKFAKSERDSLYEAMSEGEYEINQGDIRQLIQAEVRTVATANSMDKFKPAIRDRFDFIVDCDEYDADETVEVSDSLFDNFMGSFVEGEIEGTDPLLPDYLKWIEPFEPGASDNFESRGKKIKNHLIKREGFSGSIRQKNSWLRVGYTIAKLNRRDMTVDDYLQGIFLLHPELKEDEQVVQDLISIRDNGRLPTV
jgi:hypothetical protein